MKNLNHEYEIKNTYKEIPKVLSKEDAVDVLLNSKKSLSRYGDGEFSLVDGEDLAFQNCDKELQRRLTEILKSGNENLLVGLPDVFSSLKQYIPKYEDYWRNWIVVKRPSIYKMLDMSKTYCSSFISRPYMAYKDKKNVINFFKKVRKLWENRDIVVVEGKFSTLGEFAI